MASEKGIPLPVQGVTERRSLPSIRHLSLLERAFLALAIPCLFAVPLVITSSILSPLPPTVPDFTHLGKICQHVKPIPPEEFVARRDRLAGILSNDEDGFLDVYISEPGPNTQYYANFSDVDWRLSERPFLFVVTPSEGEGSTSETSSSDLVILTPSFELSRSQLLPIPLPSTSSKPIQYVPWQEKESPYDNLLGYLVERYPQSKGIRLQIEENVRNFVVEGLKDAFGSTGSKGEVGIVKQEIREQRMRKTPIEIGIQRCAAKVTMEAIREVRKHLKIGMTEVEAEKLIRDAMSAGGLTHLNSIVLFGANAALPHGSASPTSRLNPGAFALFDVGGRLQGLYSDVTRTVLPDPFTDPFVSIAETILRPISLINDHFFRRGRSNRKGAKTAGKYPTERHEQIWNLVRQAQVGALKSLEAKEPPASDVDEAARSVIAEKGLSEFFTHRLGHGIGLQGHEAPYLHGGNFHQPLLSGHTFSVEPGVYIETGKAGGDVEPGIGVRLEDVVLKTEDGYEILGGGLAQSPWEP